MNEKLKVVDADTLLSTPKEKTLFIVDGLLPQGMHILCGASKIGKSWMMLWLCLQVAKGNSIWDLKTNACDVLYLCLEDTFGRIQNRLYELTDSAPENLRFSVMCGQIGSGLEIQIEDYLCEYPKTKLVVIDTLQKVRDIKSGNGRNGMYGSDYDDIAALKQIADKHKIAIVAVHHLRKLADNDDPFNQVSGTTGITGAVDSSYVLKKDARSADTAVLLATGRDIEYQQMVLKFENRIWQMVERKNERELQQEKVPSFLFELVNFMRDKSKWTGTATELINLLAETEVKPAAVTKMLSRFYYETLEPNGIKYSLRRTGKCREIKLQRNDRNDTNDGKSHIEELPSQPSSVVTQNAVL